jgi:limonene-1,2-epoxide hydrolase
MDQRAESIVRDFLKSWENMNPDRHADWFSPDGVFDDVPVGVHTGRDAIRSAAAHYPSTTCEVRQMLSSDGVVVVERVDHFDYGGSTFALRVVGLFEVDANGNIAVQRDYYDMKGMLEALEASGINIKSRS